MSKIDTSDLEWRFLMTRWFYIPNVVVPADTTGYQVRAYLFQYYVPQDGIGIPVVIKVIHYPLAVSNGER